MGLKIRDLPPHLQKKLFGKVIKKIKNRPEQDLQIGIFDQLKPLMIAQEYKHFLAFHVPNGGWRTKMEADIFQAMGTMAGVTDIVFLFPEKVVFVELKFGKSGRANENQTKFESRVTALGFEYYLLAAKDLMDALEKIVGLLKLNGVPVGLHPTGRIYTIKER